jgi:hypothetical protein
VAGAVGAVLLLGVALIGPIVRWQVAKRAAARGLVTEVESVRPSFGGVWLLGLKAQTSRSPALMATIDSVFVPLGRRPIEIHGGFLRLKGTPAEVEAALSTRDGGEPRKRGAARTLLRADGLAVEWSGVAEGATARAWGAALSRGAGAESVAVDLATLRRPGFSLETRGLGAEFSTSDGRVLKRAVAKRLGVVLDLDARGSREDKSRAAPPPGPATTSADKSTDIAGYVALAREMAAKALPAGATARVDEARVDLMFSGEHLGFGPSTVAVERNAGEVTVAVAQGEAAKSGTPLSLRFKLPLLQGEPSLEVEGGPVTLALLGIREGELGLTRTRDATLEAHVNITLLPGASGVRATGSGRLANLSIHRPALSPDEIRGVALGFRGSGDYAFDGSRIAIDDLEVAVSEIKLQATAELTRGKSGHSVRSKGQVPLASCASLFRSLPAALTKELRGMELEGTFSLAYDMALDALRPDDFRVKLDVKNDCKISKIPNELSPSRFRGIWTREVRGPEGPMMSIQSGPGAPNWVPYPRIPKSMEIAVLVCEDGGFHRHRGFDFRAIEKAIKEDVLAGRFVRGASTISMQLAKNLYLGSEKTLSRKIQEAFLTMLLEQQLTKQELMELYLNVVELGPGVYGIQAAADHYFDTDASDLTLGQALYLASILPDPTRQHFQPDGSLSPRWAAYLRKLMGIAHKFERITDEELEAGLREEVAYRKRGDGPRPGALSSDWIESFPGGGGEPPPVDGERGDQPGESLGP